ncbi:C40 family peptidase [Mucilaginibacter xinganensis]|uniref:NlpC/P60 domain-containing protein n=1 Tax=Mucilaginibacter xinganensis TaxID=1234841 RepID=A0A223NXD0_9SPHI|nr:C40 family peptidase [Mucilaginibacter xinganensis]ASU34539.1 hypothetical protein MuYL_2652 [Mucilaginibacter xinganensis]
MEYGICNLSVVPLRAEPSDGSEQVSQVLFGETFEIVEWNDNWVKIITSFDNYPGWIGRLQFVMLGHIAYKGIKQAPPSLTHRPVTQAWKITNNSILYLPIGSSLSFLEGTTCRIGDEKFEIIGEIGEVENLAATAVSFLNAPYLWGGRTHFGIDCSGFTQSVLRAHGINLLRDASMQAEQGYEIKSLYDAKLGDLSFFENKEGKVVHVGIMLNNEKIIHASGKVKIDTIDDKGIYSKDLKRYTHKLTVVKRFF